MDSILELPGVAPAQRRAWLEAWCAGHQADAARSIVDELALLLTPAELARMLDAEKLWIPLSRLAGTTTGHAASLLWAWAASSALICGELADLGPELACNAVSAEPAHEFAWEVFEQSATEGIQPVMLERLQEWKSASPQLALRALLRLQRVASGWPEASVRAFDRLQGGD